MCRHVSIWGFQNRVCLSICPYHEKRNHLSFVNISPTLVIDTSMERSSRVLHHGNQKIWIFFNEVRNSNFDLYRRTKYQHYISNWYINRKVFTSTIAWKPKNLISFFHTSSKFEFWLLTKSWNHLSFVNIVKISFYKMDFSPQKVPTEAVFSLFQECSLKFLSLIEKLTSSLFFLHSSTSAAWWQKSPGRRSGVSLAPARKC